MARPARTGRAVRISGPMVRARTIAPAEVAPSDQSAARIRRFLRYDAVGRPDVLLFSRPHTDKITAAHITAPAAGAQEHLQAHPVARAIMLQVPRGKILPQAAGALRVKDGAQSSSAHVKAGGTILASRGKFPPEETQISEQRPHLPNPNARGIADRTLLSVTHKTSIAEQAVVAPSRRIRTLDH